MTVKGGNRRSLRAGCGDFGERKSLLRRIFSSSTFLKVKGARTGLLETSEIVKAIERIKRALCLYGGLRAV